MKKERVLVLFSYALVYVVWGSTYFFIKAAVETIPPALVVSGRFLAGAVIVLAIAWMRGALKRLPKPSEIAGSALIGVFLMLLGNGLITVAETSVPSYVVSLLAACSPLYIAVFNYALYRSAVSPIRAAGVLVGVGGIALLLYNGTSLAGSFGPGVLIAIAGVLAWGFGTSVAAKLPKAKDPFVSTAIQMGIVGVAALAIGFAADPGVIEKAAGMSAWSAFGVAYLAVLGSLTLVAYNFLLSVEPSFRISSYALVNPLIAVFLGLAAGERATPYLFLGVPLVLAGLVLMLYGDALRARFGHSPRPRSP
jgi:drug/metabolite transporter (DMT)-like permease